MLPRLALTVALLFALTGAAPARAQTPALQPLKPCYVSVNDTRTEQVVIAGTGFTPLAEVDVFLDGKNVGTQTADAQGNLPGRAISAPVVDAGARSFRVTASERLNPSRIAETSSLAVALSLRLSPARATPSTRVRWRGYGFTGSGPVYAHYLRRADYNRGRRRVRKTMRLDTPNGPCGRLSTRRRQFPFRPSPGVWVVQVDQSKAFSFIPGGAFVYFELSVARVPS